MIFLFNNLAFVFFTGREGGLKEWIEAILEGAKGAPISIVAILLLLGTLQYLVPFYKDLKAEGSYGFEAKSKIIVMGTIILILFGITFTILGFEIWHLINPPDSNSSALLVTGFPLSYLHN